ncbi:PhzF family phenazine biosynthesis protein [Albimonas pacifica]|uniref:Trans-2,3-dihydro-3-hydroxyanthranilate isomerase n=1 Tax=Albimonas pacifica TaxID=1114924 RepID=A0A1I3FTU6_9RHOB|nr:PhzF family phenazine biosynthesis protein [Albimonas pacifica]SFI14629.1 trans-2,3-dihydro-3-hydroxyanthranilate isomerase [Albimonas pacifica]
MIRRYATADVFTDAPLGGNPVATVFDAEGLSTDEMQALAVEFNYIESTFLLPPADARNTARLRIFTPDREIPFAGHPNIGTAFLLARSMAAAGAEVPGRFVFEELAGPVEITLAKDGDRVCGAELLSPQPLSRGATAGAGAAARLLGLDAADVRTDRHQPQVASVGLAFLVVELQSREALRRASRQAGDALLPLDGARSVYAYVRDDAAPGEAAVAIHARMFTPRLVEDPATGSATAAVAGLIAELAGRDVAVHASQGEDMGRPSRLVARAFRDGSTTRATVGGRCAAMFEGTFEV